MRFPYAPEMPESILYDGTQCKPIESTINTMNWLWLIFALSVVLINYRIITILLDL